jgi:hypothetical protein
MAGLLEALGLANLDFERPDGAPPDRGTAQDDSAVGAKPARVVPPLPSQETLEKRLDEQRQDLIKVAAQKGGVHAALLAGTEGLKGNQLLEKIMDNFRSIGFSYSSNYKSGGLSCGLKGDCRTLSEMFQELALEIGFADAAVKGHVGDFMCAGGPIVDSRWGNGNADDGKSWAFENHYWLVCQGGVYDVLFNRRFTDLGKPREGGPINDPETGLTRETYGGIHYYAGTIDGRAQRFVQMSEKQLQMARELHSKVLEKRKRDQAEREEEKPKEEARPDPIEQVDIEGVLERILAGPVPQEKWEATIKRLLELGETARGADRPVIFIGKEIKKFCDGPELVSKFVFNEEKWKEWVRG